ncbi:SUKH-4 family immunity protein [Streptomyces sp. NPDC046716]|uniref:SUKH-4 family immunity protein n=1 Tax=Streptomyces sp. NPDC046716 TaxID=3157093 RepID=UPI0033C75D12
MIQPGGPAAGAPHAGFAPQPGFAPQAAQTGYAPHPFIGGRGAALRTLAAWRAVAPGAPRVTLLTGSPGCGSSRLLTGFLMLCAPDYRARIDLNALDPWTVPPELPEPAVASAAGLTPAQLLWVFADHFGLDVARTAEVYEALGTAERVIVVSDVDRAGPVRAGRGPLSTARELLVPLASVPSVRLLAEVPREVAAEITAALPLGTAAIVDLDAPEYADPAGLVLQAEAALDPAGGAPQLPYAADPASRRALAQALAAGAAGAVASSRLTLQLSVSGLLLAPHPPLDTRYVPTGLDAALDLHAFRLGGEPATLRAILTPLALAEGDGLPLPLWAPLASALAGRDLAADIAQGKALVGPFVTAVDGEGDAQSIALAHPALGEAILAQLPDVRAAQLVLAMELLELIPEQGWSQAGPYVRDGVVGHVLGAGQLPRLLNDASLMAHADPVVLRAAVEEFATAESAGQLPPPARAYQRVAPLLTRSQAGPAERAAMLAAAFEEDGLEECARTLRAAAGVPSAPSSAPVPPASPPRPPGSGSTAPRPATPTPTLVDGPQQPRPATGPGNTAVFTYVDPRTGQEAYVTATSAPGRPPVEYQGMTQLEQLGVPTGNVVAIHTDLAPGYFPGGYTANVLNSAFPRVSQSYAHPYGWDPASRTEGIAALTSHAEEMARLAGQPVPPRPCRAPLPHPVPPTHVLPDAELGPLLTQVFGEKVRRFTPQALAGAALPDSARTTLSIAGIPADVPLFFLADTDSPDAPPVMGGMFADARTHLLGTGAQLAPEAADVLATHTRIGTDGVYVITVQRDSGQVWAAMPLDGRLQYVNSSVAAFAYALATLYATRGHMVDLDPYTAGRIVADLQQRLLAIDPNCLAESGHWWSLVIEQMWHGLF